MARLIPLVRPRRGPGLFRAVAGLRCGRAAAAGRAAHVRGARRRLRPLLHPAPAVDFADIGYATWQDNEPDYRLYPGDVLDVRDPVGAELSRTVTVQPDGRISLPLLPPVMATPTAASASCRPCCRRDMPRQLLRPEVNVSVKQATPLKVFVGGEVDRPRRLRHAGRHRRLAGDHHGRRLQDLGARSRSDGHPPWSRRSADDAHGRHAEGHLRSGRRSTRHPLAALRRHLCAPGRASPTSGCSSSSTSRTPARSVQLRAEQQHGSIR